LPKLAEAIYAYFTLPLLLGVVLAAGWAIPQNWRVGAFLLTLTLLFTLILSLLARNFYPRYLVFAFLPWLVLAAGGADYAIRRLPKPGLALGGLLLVCLPALWLNYQLIASPLEAPLPSVDRFQFIEGWPAGSGLGEVKNFLLAEQARQPIRVLATQYIPYNGLAVLLSDQPNLPIIYAETALARAEKPIKQALKTGLAFFVMLEPDDLETLAAYQAAYPAFQFHPVLSVPRPGDHYRLKVYRLDPR